VTRANESLPDRLVQFLKYSRRQLQIHFRRYSIVQTMNQIIMRAAISLPVEPMRKSRLPGSLRSMVTQRRTSGTRPKALISKVGGMTICRFAPSPCPFPPGGEGKGE